MRILRVAAIIALVGAIWLPQASAACSVDGPTPLAKILERGEIRSDPVVGFHEQRHIARIPGILGLQSARSASVPTRYWGQAPNLSVATHGNGHLFVGDCGSVARPIGFTSLHASTERSVDRPRHDHLNVSRDKNTYLFELNAEEEALLAAEFGPPVAVTTGFDDYVVAYALLLWRPLMGAAVVASVGWAVAIRIRGVISAGDRIFDQPTALAAVAGVVGIAAVAESYGMLDLLGLLAALALLVGLGGLARSELAIAAPVLIAILTVQVRLFGQPGSSDERLQGAIAVLLVGAASLIWSRRHWSRWVASATVVAGAFSFTLGVLETRGYRSMPKMAGVAVVVAALAGLACWLLVFRDRGSHDEASQLQTDP